MPIISSTLLNYVTTPWLHSLKIIPQLRDKAIFSGTGGSFDHQRPHPDIGTHEEYGNSLAVDMPIDIAVEFSTLYGGNEIDLPNFEDVV